jgi:hypothetical protein
VCRDGTGRRVLGGRTRVEAADFAGKFLGGKRKVLVGDEGRLGAWMLQRRTGQGFID